ncbi:AsnC family transcriptional regulator [Flavobacterium akiainvivens]|uniref:AsnC family transcriptional regulator n=1 Tax=Flavobacterium akiainvivens TaxID=1202724 RepID=A0A0M9VGV1_9FLAO|nr:Lrp/AsnC family transcriptional regulator [Flavobacterium akiainvivens]KOS04609.1 AsnC family transcriptional regulator [Flavobacterium akiainvivens]SFQ65846.1 Lrp/AsnC family transcriptional regulator, leucine-responsive regulatory protein [Flavobacterium akiainvivens]
MKEIYSVNGVDNIDLQLLNILHNNSNYTTKELAQMVNLSASPVFERVKRLEKNGYIKKYIAILDGEKLNQGFTVFCNIKLKQHDRSIGHKFVTDIMDIDEIIECYNISGDYDFLLKVTVRDMKHYQDFVFNKLGSVDSIGSTHSTFVMAEIKNTFGAAVREE